MQLKAKFHVLEAVNRSKMLMPVSGEKAKKLKQMLTMILDDFQTRCETIGVTPFLVYGSALGALRHGGFIPWDDDVDVAITREDWNVLKQNFDKVFSDKYDLEGPDYKGKDSFSAWGKVFLKNTRYVELFNVNTPYNKGIFIDIFIIDGLSDNFIVRKIDYAIARAMRFIANSMPFYQYPNDVMTKVMSITKESKRYLKFREFIGFCFSWVSHQKWLVWYDRFISRHTKTKKTIMNYDDAVTLRGAWFPVKQIKFENIMANVPNDIEGYLNMAFGPTYMELPPEDKREQHFCVELDFGEY